MSGSAFFIVDDCMKNECKMFCKSCTKSVGSWCIARNSFYREIVCGWQQPMNISVMVDPLGIHSDSPMTRGWVVTHKNKWFKILFSLTVKHAHVSFKHILLICQAPLRKQNKLLSDQSAASRFSLPSVIMMLISLRNVNVSEVIFFNKIHNFLCFSAADLD